MPHDLYHGVKHGAKHGVKHNLGSLYGPAFDGSSSIYRPVSASDWLALGFPIPDYRWPLQEASGSVVDEVRGVSMAASGAVTYQQSGTEAAYTSKGVATVDGTASMGFTATAANLWNITYQSVVAYLEFEATAVPAALRSFFALTGAASMYVGMTVSSGKAVLSLRPNGAVNGTYDYNDGKRHPIIIELTPGASVLDHVTSRFRYSTDKEQLTGTWVVAGNGTKGLATGGSASLTSAPAKYFDCAVWTGTSADTVAASPKSLLQAKGWTVTGY